MLHVSLESYAYRSLEFHHKRTITHAPQEKTNSNTTLNCDRLNLPPAIALAKRCPETHPRRPQTKRATHTHSQTLLCKHATKSPPTAKYPQRVSSSRQHSQASRGNLATAACLIYGILYSLAKMPRWVGVYNTYLPPPSDSPLAGLSVVQCIVIVTSSFLLTFRFHRPVRYFNFYCFCIL